MKRNNFLLLVSLLLVSAVSYSQSVISPYSSNGLGELNTLGLPHSNGMADVGIATPTLFHINNINPALLTFNTLTTFQVGFQADRRSFRASNTTATDGTGSLRYLSVAFPIKISKWTSSVSLLPYSTVNYDFFFQEPIQGTDIEAINVFGGSGGLTRVDWSNGFAINKRLSVGVRGTFLFGNIENTLESRLIDPAAEDSTSFSAFDIEYREELSYSELLLSFGGFYSIPISENRSINVGLTYELPRTLEGSRSETFIREAAGTAIQDQDITESEPTRFDLPTTIGFGLSYREANKLTIGTDIVLRRGGEFERNPNLFRETFKLAVGGEFIPEYNSVRNYFNRVSYRAGFSAKQLPYIVNGTEINEFGINFGVSLPVNGFSSTDFGFRVGWRGTTENNLIRENFFQIVLGITFNDRWFIKRRFD